jgi:hypothetical protein
VPNLNNLENPAPQSQTFQGLVVVTATGLGVNVNGNVIPARWADPLVVAAGDTVLVEVSGGLVGQGEAFVRCRLNKTPRPAQATVTTVPPSSPTITVTGTDGTAYTATFVSSYTPTVNDSVILSWNAAVPTVLGKTGTVAAPTPTPPTPPPPSAPTAGTSFYPATDSDTYWSGGGWGSVRGSVNDVTQGTVYGTSNPVSGAWFYAGTTTELAGRTITRIQLRVGSRKPIGSNNAALNAHLYAHTSATKPGGDVSRTVGPYDVTIQPGAAPQTFDLPLTFASVLLAGGGISITGDPYLGFYGRYTQTDSGTLALDWTR